MLQRGLACTLFTCLELSSCRLCQRCLTNVQIDIYGCMTIYISHLSRISSPTFWYFIGTCRFARSCTTQGRRLVKTRSFHTCVRSAQDRHRCKYMHTASKPAINLSIPPSFLVMHIFLHEIHIHVCIHYVYMTLHTASTTMWAWALMYVGMHIRTHDWPSGP